MKSPQTQMALIGSTSREIALHSAKEIAACGSLQESIYRALIHADMTQDHLADRVQVSPAYLSLILAGKRLCPAPVVLRIVKVTGSAAPLQWMAKEAGVSIYVDPVESERARLKSRLAELDAA